MSDFLDELDAQRVQLAADRMRVEHPQRIEAAGGNVRLAIYLTLADRTLVRRFGVTHLDLADYCWADAFADGVAPREAALAAVEFDGMFI